MTATLTATPARRVAPRPAPRPRSATATRSGGAARAASATASVAVPVVPAERVAPRAQRDLRVVRTTSRVRWGRAVVAMAIFSVFGSLLVSAVVHSMLVKGQSHIDDLNRQIRVERKALEEDRLALARASSPARLAAEAERLGLVEADTQTWIRPGSDAAPVITGDKDRTPSAADDVDEGRR